MPCSLRDFEFPLVGSTDRTVLGWPIQHDIAAGLADIYFPLARVQTRVTAPSKAHCLYLHRDRFRRIGSIFAVNPRVLNAASLHINTGQLRHIPGKRLQRVGPNTKGDCRNSSGPAVFRPAGGQMHHVLSYRSSSRVSCVSRRPWPSPRSAERPSREGGRRCICRAFHAQSVSDCLARARAQRCFDQILSGILWQARLRLRRGNPSG